MLPPIYETAIECDDGSVDLAEYDAILREWLRERLKDTSVSKSFLATAGLHKSDIINATNNKKNVSKQIFVQVARLLDIPMATALHQLSMIADRVQRGERLPMLMKRSDITVREEDAVVTQRIVSAVSKSLPRAKKARTAQPLELPPTESEDPFESKS